MGTEVGSLKKVHEEDNWSRCSLACMGDPRTEGLKDRS